jgi:hypothetical protein
MTHPSAHFLQALHISDFMHNSLKSLLCTKAYQRRAVAHRALQQYNRAVQDLECAVSNDQASKELQAALAAAKRDLEENRKEQKLRKAMAALGRPPQQQQQQQASLAEGNGPGCAKNLLLLPNTSVEEGGAVSLKLTPDLDKGFDINKLKKVETLVQDLQSWIAASLAVGVGASSVAAAGIGAVAGVTAPSDESASEERRPSTSSGPKLPDRTCVNKPSGDQAQKYSSSSSSSSRSSTERGVEEKRAVVKGGIQELNLLLEGDDLACVYFRECGGLSALFKV